nr:type I secretion C-terminal target domain-containing protein [Paracraurococcus ruber]
MGQPNAAVTGPDGERGVVAFAQELNGFAFTTVIGGAGDDRLGGTARAERFEGHDGDDVLLGREGGDTLLGGIGRDVLSGGAGDDSLGGGEDADVLAAGAGRNTLEGGGGADRFVIAAGPGHDRIEDFSAAQGDLLDLSAFGLSPQALKAVLAGAAATEEGLLLRIPAAGGPHSLLLAGLESLDAAQVMRVAGRAVEADAVVVSGPRDGLVAGGAADDTLLGRDGGQALDGRAGDDVILAGQGADRLAGGTGDDVLDGGGGNDTADGGADDDVVFGGAGDDRLTGGDGDDFLDGGEGDDRLEGGLGTNTLTGEAGRDIFAFARFKETADRVTDFADGVDLIDIRLLVKFQATAETLGSYLQVTSPGATELTRFLLVDRDGARGEFGFERVAQFDNVTDAMLLDPGNYLF